MGQENAADKGRRFSPCRLAGYLLASSESAIYLAPAREKGARVSPSEEPKLTGGVVRIPADAVIELRTRAPTAVSRPEPDGQDDGPVQPLLK